jgi:hypothetical protein
MEKRKCWNMSFGFLGIQMGFTKIQTSTIIFGRANIDEHPFYGCHDQDIIQPQIWYLSMNMD